MRPLSITDAFVIDISQMVEPENVLVTVEMSKRSGRGSGYRYVELVPVTVSNSYNLPFLFGALLVV